MDIIGNNQIRGVECDAVAPHFAEHSGRNSRRQLFAPNRRSHRARAEIVPREARIPGNSSPPSRSTHPLRSATLAVFAVWNQRPDCFWCFVLSAVVSASAAASSPVRISPQRRSEYSSPPTSRKPPRRWSVASKLPRQSWPRCECAWRHLQMCRELHYLDRRLIELSLPRGP